jgi:hypothetical protein
MTTGDEWPGGSTVCHITFFSGPNWTGRFLDDDSPVPPLPRNWGQSSATKAKAQARRGRMRAGTRIKE